MKKTYKAIIYDIDGTVLNTLAMNMYPLMKIIKEETGEDWTYEEVLKFAAYPGMKVMEELDVKDKEKTYARWVQYVNEYEEGATLYEGMEDVLKGFQAHNVLQAVVSAKTKQQYQIDVVEKGLDQYMFTAILADDTQQHKPDPQPLLECLKRLQLQPEEVIYIGDALSDYLAAKNAHIDFGYAMWGSVSSEGIIDPAYTFEKPLDVLTLLEKTEMEKMLAGELYDCGDPQLMAQWHKAKNLMRTYNQLDSEDSDGKQKILKSLLGKCDQVWITFPFYVDYGCNIYIGEHTEINMNCTFLDDNKIVIGKHGLIAPNVNIYTAYHPTHYMDRFGEDTGDGFQFCKTETAPVIIGDYVWIGGGSVILPGVHIGDNVVIGAGSVVTHDIPSNVIAYGNPCKVIKENKRQK